MWTTWERMALVTRLPFPVDLLDQDNRAFKVVGYKLKLTGTPSNNASSFKVHLPQTYEFGKKQLVKRSCQASWFSTWPWLHYQTNNPNDVLCHVCVSALSPKAWILLLQIMALRITRMPPSASKPMKHLQAIKKPCTWSSPATYSDVGEMLSREHAQEKSRNVNAYSRYC